MADVKAVLTEALCEALGRVWTDPEDDADQQDWDELPGKLADALLALPGVAVIQLPQPSWRKPADEDEHGASAWDYPDGEVVVYDTGDFEWRSFGINDDDASRLRDGAAALLAAAVLSEETTTEGVSGE